MEYVKNASLLVTMLVVALCASEILVRALAPQNISGSWRVHDQTGLHLNKSGGRTTHQFDDRKTVYDFGEFGTREAIGGPARYRIVVVGDSFTFGWGLDKGQTYVDLLQAKTDDRFGNGVFQFLNAAAGGWGADSYTAYIEDYGEYVSPDIVLVFLNTDDIGRALKNDLYAFKGSQLERQIKEIPLVEHIPEWIPAYNMLIEHSHLANLIRKSILVMMYNRPSSGERNVGPVTLQAESDVSPEALGEALFSRIKAWAEAHDAYLVVATTAWHNPPYGEHEPTEKFLKNAEPFFEDIEVPFYDGSGSFEKTSSILIPNDGHPNEVGAKHIADVNWPFLEEQLKLFCEENGCRLFKTSETPPRSIASASRACQRSACVGTLIQRFGAHVAITPHHVARSAIGARQPLVVYEAKVLQPRFSARIVC